LLKKLGRPQSVEELSPVSYIVNCTIQTLIYQALFLFFLTRVRLACKNLFSNLYWRRGWDFHPARLAVINHRLVNRPRNLDTQSYSVAAKFQTNKRTIQLLLFHAMCIIPIFLSGSFLRQDFRSWLTAFA